MSEFFLSENFQFLEIKISIHLNRRVFVMLSFDPKSPSNSIKPNLNFYPSRIFLVSNFDTIRDAFQRETILSSRKHAYIILTPLNPIFIW